MESNNKHKSSRRKRAPISHHAQLMSFALRKLDMVPHHAGYPYGVLTPDEFEACTQLLRAAIAHIWAGRPEHSRSRYKPRMFEYQGARYRLAYSGSTLGRLFIVSPAGRNVIGSGYFAI